MSAVYSTQFFLGHAVDTESFVVPDDKRAVIRTITAFWQGGELGAAAQLVDAATDVTLWWNFQGTVIEGAYAIEPDCRIIIDPGGTVGILGFGNPDIGVFGYLLSL